MNKDRKNNDILKHFRLKQEALNKKLEGGPTTKDEKSKGYRTASTSITGTPEQGNVSYTKNITKRSGATKSIVTSGDGTKQVITRTNPRGVTRTKTKVIDYDKNIATTTRSKNGKQQSVSTYVPITNPLAAAALATNVDSLEDMAAKRGSRARKSMGKPEARVKKKAENWVKREIAKEERQENRENRRNSVSPKKARRQAERAAEKNKRRRKNYKKKKARERGGRYGETAQTGRKNKKVRTTKGNKGKAMSGKDVRQCRAKGNC